MAKPTQKNQQDVKAARAAQRNYAKFVARYWADPEFRKKATIDPAAALKAFGINFDSKKKIEFVEIDPAEVVVLVPKPEKNLDLEVVLQANCVGSAGTIGTAFTMGGCGGTFGSLFCFGCSETCLGGGDDDDPDDEEPDDDDDDKQDPEEPQTPDNILGR